MTPTREQIEQVAAATWEGTGIYSGYQSFWNAPAQRAIHKWEEIRPKEDASQLQRTNHALAAELKEQAERDEFEKWANTEELSLKTGADGLYCHLANRTARAAWKALAAKGGSAA